MNPAVFFLKPSKSLITADVRGLFGTLRIKLRKSKSFYNILPPPELINTILTLVHKNQTNGRFAV